MVAPEIQLVLVQSNEKWFYSIAVRQFNKLVPFLGCKPVVHGIHHKCHIGKILAFAMTAYAPKNNNFQLGGEAFKVLLERAGAVVKAKQTSYKRQ